MHSLVDLLENGHGVVLLLLVRVLLDWRDRAASAHQAALGGGWREVVVVVDEPLGGAGREAVGQQQQQEGRCQGRRGKNRKGLKKVQGEIRGGVRRSGNDDDCTLRCSPCACRTRA